MRTVLRPFALLALVSCAPPAAFPSLDPPSDTSSLLLAASLPSEDAEEGPSGFLLGSPVGITSNTADGTVLIKSAGFTPGGPPAGWPADLPLPNFSQFPGDCFTGITSTSGEEPIQAMSMGLDVLVFDAVDLEGGAMVDDAPLPGGTVLPVAVADLGTHGWMAFQFSVDSELLLGVPDAELAHDVHVARAAKELDRTVFSYLVPGSYATTLSIEGESVHAMSPAAIGLTGGSDRIDALNMHMALYYTDLSLYPNVFTTRPLTPAPCIYFTMRGEYLLSTAGAVAAAWGVANVNTATIYVTRWNGENWTQPVPYATLAELGMPLPEKGPAQVIDGLSIDAKEPGQTGAAANGDEILFSLADEAPEQQVLYAKKGSGEPPRRVVIVRPGSGGYGSLGREFKIGKALGDFCTKDPWWRSGQEVTDNEHVLDDFFVARRLAPAEPFVSPYYLENLTVFPISFGPTPMVASTAVWPVRSPTPGQRLPRLPRLGSPYFLDPQPVAVVPGTLSPVVVPQLALAIAGYRHQTGTRPMMRTCMSWPRPTADSGHAVVRWGRMAKFYAGAETITWFAPDDGGLVEFEYTGEPLVADFAIPAGGLLRREPPAASEDERAYALVAQWRLEAGGKVFVSPISALRY